VGDFTSTRTLKATRGSQLLPEASRSYQKLPEATKTSQRLLDHPRTTLLGWEGFYLKLNLDNLIIRTLWDALGRSGVSGTPWDALGRPGGRFYLNLNLKGYQRFSKAARS